jgi:hypothetical protein
VTGLLVTWNGNIPIVQRGICVTQSNGRQVYARCLFERLVLSPRICHHQKSQLPEGLLNRVSEGSRTEKSSNQSDFSGSGEFSTACWPGFLENMTLTSAGFSLPILSDL